MSRREQSRRNFAVPPIRRLLPGSSSHRCSSVTLLTVRPSKSPAGALPRMSRAYLSLGSNLGDRLTLLREAEVRVVAVPGIRVLARSSIYETKPVGLEHQPWFLNRVLLIETALDPHALLDALQQVENALGRTRTVRWGPRTIDIDLLLYDDRTVTSERLRIPHAELPYRRFVLLPLVELDPHARLPDGRFVQDLLDTLEDDQIVRKIAPLQE